MRLADHSQGRLRVVHVPKTIDNDLDLPQGIVTFGYQTARHFGVDIVKNLMVDARTTSRWYLVITMGRKAGHLALGIGKAAGATMTVIPEEFDGKPRPSGPHRRHPGRRDHQAPRRRSRRRHRGHGRRAGRVPVTRRPARVRRGRVRRARPSAPGRDQHRRRDQGAFARAAGQARHQVDAGRQGHRLRAALRRPDSARHGVHARPGLLRRQLHPGRRHRTPW